MELQHLTFPALLDRFTLSKKASPPAAKKASAKKASAKGASAKGASPPAAKKVSAPAAKKAPTATNAPAAKKLSADRLYTEKALDESADNLHQGNYDSVVDFYTGMHEKDKQLLEILLISCQEVPMEWLKWVHFIIIPMKNWMNIWQNTICQMSLNTTILPKYWVIVNVEFTNKILSVKYVC